MSSLWLSFVVLMVLLGLVGFLWFWWATPRDQVPPHFTSDDLRRLEVQDRLRQTSYQILTALALGATFLATVFQFSATTRQWSADFELKSAQERLTQYTEAIKGINPAGQPTGNVASITSLQLLAVQDPPRFHRQVSEVLTQFIADRQSLNGMVDSAECEGRSNPPTDATVWTPRNEAPAALGVAMKAVGHPNFAAHRLNYSTDYCQANRQTVDRGPLVLEHMSLDNLDLSGRDFSCAKMSQSHFHRTSFAGADLRKADLRGTQLADFDTPGFPGDQDIGHKLYISEDLGGPPEWKKYRCWVTDFRYAKLNGADFEGAIIAGADFGNADLTGVNFCRADISRVNFTGAIVTAKQLSEACVGASYNPADFPAGSPAPYVEEAQPFGIEHLGKDFRVPRCAQGKVCKYDNARKQSSR